VDGRDKPGHDEKTPHAIAVTPEGGLAARPALD
jgi:hypothetical protein